MTSYRLTPNEHVGPLTITGQSSLSSLWSWASVYFAPCTGRHMIVELVENPDLPNPCPIQ